MQTLIDSADDPLSAPTITRHLIYVVSYRNRDTEMNVASRDRYFTYPFCLKYSIASPVLRNTRVAVSVMKGDGMPLHAQTT